MQARARAWVVVVAAVVVGAAADWTATGSLRSARAGHTATALLNGRVLVAGGVGAGRGCLDSAETYDPVSGQWNATGAMNSPRCYHAATLLDDNSGRVMVTGGIAANGSFLSRCARAAAP
jgi:N-acetylneuraminic acid mutarotase